MNYAGMYCVRILEKPFVFRKITRREYEGLLSLRCEDGLPDYRFDVEVCNTAVVEPKINDWFEMECGVAPILSLMIQECSGCIVTKEYMHNTIEYKKSILENDNYIQMESIIEHVFPQYTKEKFLDISYDELIGLYVKAEYAIKFKAEQSYIHQMNIMAGIKAKENQYIQEEQAKQKAQELAKRRRFEENIYGSGVM